VKKGERVFTLAEFMPEVHIAALGALKNGNVFCALFSAFGPQPIFQRLAVGDARVLLTTSQLYQRRELEQLRHKLPRLAHILLTDAEDDAGGGLWSLPRRMAAASPNYTIGPTRPDDLAFLHFTSGTTGTPKGALHAHQAVLVHYLTGKTVLDFRSGDVLWCTADPGWITGISYGLVAPLLHGITSLVVRGGFDAEYWCRVLRSEGVTVWYTAPTAIRRLARMGPLPLTRRPCERLRRIFSVGEALHLDTIAWARENLGIPIYDTWWQTETGGIMIANSPALGVRPGSLGRPLSGIEAAVIRRGADGSPQVVETPGVVGELALRTGWPSMFRGYLDDAAGYLNCFAGPWYLSGDLVQRDGDDYFWFVSRGDDMIKTSGHRVGPCEIEDVLLEHPAVAEVGVIGVPDRLIGEAIKAFVTLKLGIVPDELLQAELIGYARQKLGAAFAPREVEFRSDLPKTNSGKISRKSLRAFVAGRSGEE
jgi:acetyl-CoA synthetase